MTLVRTRSGFLLMLAFGLVFGVTLVSSVSAWGPVIVPITPGDPEWDDILCGGYCVMTEGEYQTIGFDCQSCYCADCLICCTACTQVTDPSICTDSLGAGHVVDTCVIDECGFPN